MHDKSVWRGGLEGREEGWHKSTFTKINTLIQQTFTSNDNLIINLEPLLKMYRIVFAKLAVIFSVIGVQQWDQEDLK